MHARVYRFNQDRYKIVYDMHTQDLHALSLRVYAFQVRTMGNDNDNYNQTIHNVDGGSTTLEV